MEPIPQPGGPLGRDHAAEFHGVSGWPAQPKLVPTVIVCTWPCDPLSSLHCHTRHLREQEVSWSLQQQLVRHGRAGRAACISTHGLQGI